MSKPTGSSVSVEKHGKTPELSYDEFVATLSKERVKPEPRVPSSSKKAVRARRRTERRRAKDCRTIVGVETLAADPCAYCNEPNPTTHDHIEPFSQGGAHELENLVRCCWRCNKAKGTRSLIVFLARRRAQ